MKCAFFLAKNETEGTKKAGQRPAFLGSNENYLDAAEAAASAAGAAAGADAPDAAASAAGADAGVAAADAGAASTEADAEADADVSAGLLHATKATANKETSKSDFFMFLLSINRSKKTTNLR